MFVLNSLSSIFSTPFGGFAALFVVLFFDYLILFPRYWLLRVLHGPAGTKRHASLPSGLLIIPSLLRARDELDAIKATIESVTTNDYPSDLIVIASIDGYLEAEPLYRELETWVQEKQASLPPRVWLHLTGRKVRGGKPLAIEEGVQHMHVLLGQGVHAAMPKIYFSTDADADLGPRALENIAARLCMKNPITGSPGRVVAGNLYVRGNAYWKGLRHFFTQEGQVSIQVAREYLVTSVTRYNMRPMPIAGTTGVLYCMWTDIFLQGPRFMGFMRSLRRWDWVKWWVGFAPPKFSESNVAPIPELMAGDTDDTVSAFLGIIARWKDGSFTLDAPRTPLHAIYYMLRSLLVDRALRHEPEARVYTSSPTTVKTLWKQRVRWNTARIEVTGRFSRSLWYHWDLGICTLGTLALTMRYIAVALYCYVQLPLVILKGSGPIRIGLAFAVQLGVYTAWTLMALVMNAELRRNWRLLMAIPLAPVYTIVFAFCATLKGIINDLFLFGNVTKFAPESTLIKGQSTRVAILARVRRAMVLLVRSAFFGDVPVGMFWLGWNETRWTPSGFLGWTTGKRPTLWQRLRYDAAQATVEEVALAPVAAANVDILRDSMRIAHVAPANNVGGEPFAIASVDAAPAAPAKQDAA